jgi:hypothetical protein
MFEFEEFEEYWNIIEDTEDTLFPYSQEKAWEDLFALEEVDGGYIEAIQGTVGHPSLW